MIVTTAGRTNEAMVHFAEIIAEDLQSEFVPRNKRAIGMMKETAQQDVLVVGKNRLELYSLKTDEPLFFHPNSAMFRIKRMIKGEYEPFLEATKLQEGDQFLDCTLGLGSDSIVASYAVGTKGKVTGVEANSFLAYIVRTGLSAWHTEFTPIDEAMKRVNVIQGDHGKELEQMESGSADVIYFDPMFEETIAQSSGLNPLKSFAHYDILTESAINEAKRVARKRIVLKDHWKSEKFAQYGFEVIKRKTAKFHYGVIELE
ncbi:class I SAM-dependent methyltransferase [Metabacillus fastidiosus]|uniref:class I SAM-dependent methyltransferase n=1 Tax=Metabacillus fastidiosus TaxID=1458 RepID=UPI003D2CD6B5